MEHIEKEIQILENIQQNSTHVKQRDLAEIIGLSLGMTNSILKRLAKKGWLIIKKINNRNIRYAITPQGIDEITKRSYRYFKRTIKNVVDYRRIIESLVEEIKGKEYTGVVLVGKSDLDFIVEHACHKQHLDLVRDEEHYEGRLFYLYGESYIPENATDVNGEGREFLQKVFLG